jgi:hypothetical protein
MSFSCSSDPPASLSQGFPPQAMHLHAVGSQRGLERVRAQELRFARLNNYWSLAYLIVAVLLVLSNMPVRLPVSRCRLPFGHVRVSSDGAPAQHHVHPARQLRLAIRSLRRSRHRLGLSWLDLNAQLNALFAV